MLEYLEGIFSEDAFSDAYRKREIEDYIIKLSQEVKSIARSLRNDAAHVCLMSHAKAEACGNVLIKVQKLIGKFLEKLK